MYYTYYFWGMHMIWWILWLLLLIWIFILPYDIPGSRNKKDTPVDILKKRLASGEITLEEYQNLKKTLTE